MKEAEHIYNTNLERVHTQVNKRFQFLLVPSLGCRVGNIDYA